MWQLYDDDWPRRPIPGKNLQQQQILKISAGCPSLVLFWQLQPANLEFQLQQRSKTGLDNDKTFSAGGWRKTKLMISAWHSMLHTTTLSLMAQLLESLFIKAVYQQGHRMQQQQQHFYGPRKSLPETLLHKKNSGWLWRCQVRNGNECKIHKIAGWSGLRTWL